MWVLNIIHQSRRGTRMRGQTPVSAVARLRERVRAVSESHPLRVGAAGAAAQHGPDQDPDRRGGAAGVAAGEPWTLHPVLSMMPHVFRQIAALTLASFRAAWARWLPSSSLSVTWAHRPKLQNLPRFVPCALVCWRMASSPSPSNTLQARLGDLKEQCTRAHAETQRLMFAHRRWMAQAAQMVRHVPTHGRRLGCCDTCRYEFRLPNQTRANDVADACCQFDDRFEVCNKLCRAASWPCRDVCTHLTFAVQVFSAELVSIALGTTRAACTTSVRLLSAGCVERRVRCSWEPRPGAALSRTSARKLSDEDGGPAALLRCAVSL